MSNICFIVRSCVFLMECQLSEWFFPMNNADSNITDMNIPISQNVFLVFWRAHNGLPSSFIRFFLIHNGLPCSVVLGLLMTETWLELVCLCPRGDNGLYRSIIHRFVSFPLLRRPSFVIIPPWVACWVHVTVDNGLSRSIIFPSFRTPGTLTSIAFLLRAFWRRRWQSWGSPCNKTHHWPLLFCDSFFTWILLHYFFAIPSEQTVGLKWLTLNKHKRWFHSSRVKFPLVKCLRVGFWCRCTWFGFVGPNWFDRITNQGQLCGSWKHVSLWDFFLL